MSKLQKDYKYVRKVDFNKKTGELGFEPRQTAPEAVVLPLHYSPN